MVILILFAFLAGIVTILSPCILPILPVVLSGGLGGGHRRPIGVVVGFVLSFTFFTLFLATLVKLTGVSANFLRGFSIIVILLFGISLLIPQFQFLVEKMFTKLSGIVHPGGNSNGFFGGLLIGLSLGIIWTPCVGPILASVIALALAGTINGTAIVITFAYALGTAIPMFAIIIGGRALLQKVPWLLRNTANIQKAFGVIMILVALALFFNLDRNFQTYILDKFPQYGAGLTKLEENNAVKKQLSEPLDSIDTEMAPEIIPGGQWFNSPPLKLSDLKGKVVLIDFWTYSCINCIRTLPYLKDWNEKYKDRGLVIIGVHTPEFEFEKDSGNVEKAIADFEITYPVVQDNNYDTWNAYNNRYWPAKYFIDKNGKIRSSHFGEGDYDESEKLIQTLLSENGPAVSEPIKNLDYQIYSQTPELYLGYDRIQYLVNSSQIVEEQLVNFVKPPAIPQNWFAYIGPFIVGKEYAMPQKGSSLILKFDAKDVYLVANPKNGSSQFQVLLDGKVVNSSESGEDVKNGNVTVNENRLYKLIHLTNPGRHTLELKFLDNNSDIFAFTFG